MIKLQNVNTPIEGNIDYKKLVANNLNLNVNHIKSVKLYRRSVDARKKPNIFYCNTYLIEFYDSKISDKVLKTNKNASVYSENPYVFQKSVIIPPISPVIIGSGPAGLFAGLVLARSGIPPIIIEKGEPIDQRVKSVDSFWNGSKINEKSNVQFGEGGAGTFSDGKLNTGIKDPRCRTVLETFCEFGANQDILINAKPHIGTDVLRAVVKNIRNEIIGLGGEYRFNTEFIKPFIKNGKVNSILLTSNNQEYILPCDKLILALGNAARDTYKNLWDSGIEIIPKSFAVGMRIEHLQENINIARYGKNHPSSIPPAEYKLATHLKNGRGVYSFCMCPGGKVVNSSSEENSYVTNGMSYQSRSETNANSALLVGINPQDFSHLGGKDPFGGIEFQKQIEKAAYSLTNGAGMPTQTVGEFLNQKTDSSNKVSPTALPKTIECDLTKIFPKFITDSIKEALPIFDKQISGFASSNAVLTAPETRSSTPIRILRDDLFLSNIGGIYPCGEGAGYAGGITSSAVDGIRTAEAIIQQINF